MTASATVMHNFNTYYESICVRLYTLYNIDHSNYSMQLETWPAKYSLTFLTWKFFLNNDFICCTKTVDKTIIAQSLHNGLPFNMKLRKLLCGNHFIRRRYQKVNIVTEVYYSLNDSYQKVYTFNHLWFISIQIWKRCHTYVNVIKLAR